ncbi:MAG: biotin-dependent carboxyltransferase family protein [Burkholderiales bacterium]
MKLRVLKGGMLTTLQDSGRHGYQHLGVPASGAMDLFAHRVANLLVGNTTDEATLEITLQGPRLEFEADTLIAICGADLSPSIAGVAVPEGRPVLVRKGAELDFGVCRSGCRAYLAVQGGFSVAPVMGSRSTYEPARLGGWQGRALRGGDQLPIGAASRPMYPGLAAELANAARDFAFPKWSVNQHNEKIRRSPQMIRIVSGRHWDDFPAPSREVLTGAEFRVGVDSNRMGYRLTGPQVGIESLRAMVSEAVTFGTIQVPQGGQPILLMADRQTVGGYPKVAEVAGVDLHLAAQLKPGDSLRFELVAPAQSRALWLKRELEFMTISEAIEKHSAS